MKVEDFFVTTETELKPKELRQALSDPQLRLAFVIARAKLQEATNIMTLPRDGDDAELCADARMKIGALIGFSKTLEALVELTVEDEENAG